MTVLWNTFARVFRRQYGQWTHLDCAEEPRDTMGKSLLREKLLLAIRLPIRSQKECRCDHAVQSYFLTTGDSPYYCHSMTGLSYLPHTE